MCRVHSTQNRSDQTGDDAGTRYTLLSPYSTELRFPLHFLSLFHSGRDLYENIKIAPPSRSPEEIQISVCD